MSNVALGAGLAGLPLLSGARTRSVCPENPTGEKGKGGMAVPDPETLPFSDAASDLGQGWKVSPFVQGAGGADAHRDGRGRAGRDSAHLAGGRPGQGALAHHPILLGRRGDPVDRDAGVRLLRRRAQQLRVGQLAGGHLQPEVGVQLLLADAVPRALPDHLHQRGRRGAAPAHLPGHLPGDRGAGGWPATCTRSGGAPSPSAPTPTT